MPVKNKNVDGSNVPGKNKKLDLEDDDDADGKQDDCSDLTDNNHETDESSSKSFPQKVSSWSMLLIYVSKWFALYEKRNISKSCAFITTVFGLCLWQEVICVMYIVRFYFHNFCFHFFTFPSNSTYIRRCLSQL